MEAGPKNHEEKLRQEANCQTENLHKREGVLKQGKKDRNSARHSFHQAMVNVHGSKPVFEPIEYEGFRSLVSRERSFVRPRSKLVHVQPHPQIKEQQHSHQQKRKSSGMAANPKTKPALEIYRPPTLRGPSNFEVNGESYYNEKNFQMPYYDTANSPINNSNANGSNDNNTSNSNNNNRNNHNNHRNSRSNCGKKPGLNIHAKEFISFHQGFGHIHHSASSTNVFKNPNFPEGLKHSKSGKDISARKLDGTKVHFTEFPQNDPDAKVGMAQRTLQSESSTGLPVGAHNPIKRSKSLGSVDFCQTAEDKNDSLFRIGPFPQEVQKSILDSINDPNKQSARQLMDGARHILSRAVESSKHSEPTAQICIKIIEKEKGETFLETLLNTCQEFFQKRDRILRNPQNASSHAGGVVSHPKWIAYMSFLSEIYTQLKRRQNQLMNQRIRNSETPPGLYILSLLAQCCYVCLQEPSINSLSETECLFFVLTAVGKDIEQKLPTLMSRVMSSTRDAFLKFVHVPSVRKTLLQLIEMHAAKWNLSAPAVMYYYPGCATKLISDAI